MFVTGVAYVDELETDSVDDVLVAFLVGTSFGHYF